MLAGKFTCTSPDSWTAAAEDEALSCQAHPSDPSRCRPKRDEFYPVVPTAKQLSLTVLH